MMALFFYAQFTYLEDAWQTEAIAPNAMVIYGCTTRLLHALTILLYGSGFFMMEAYHSEGTAECWGWSVLFLYKLAAIAGQQTRLSLCMAMCVCVWPCVFVYVCLWHSLIFSCSPPEFAAVLFNSRLADVIFTCLYLGALISALIWAQSFEPLIIAHEVKMDQSALRNEWFKSRNAMAYYGPPVEEGMELVAEARDH